MSVDPRGQRFNAALTAIVLVIVLITGSAWLLGFQAVVFGIGAVFGLRYAPYGLIYRFAVRPRLGPPAELEAEAPPRFSQAVGLVISIIGVIGQIDGYQLPDAKGFTSLVQTLIGDSAERRQRRRDEVLGTTSADFRALGDVLAEASKIGHVAVLGSEGAIKAANDERGGFLKVTRVL